jgi:hypothetical protein
MAGITKFRCEWIAVLRDIKAATCQRSRSIALPSLALLLACGLSVPAAAQFCQPAPPPSVSLSITPASCTSRAVLHITYDVPTGYNGEYFVTLFIDSVVNGELFHSASLIRLDAGGTVDIEEGVSKTEYWPFEPYWTDMPGEVLRVRPYAPLACSPFGIGLPGASVSEPVPSSTCVPKQPEISFQVQNTNTSAAPESKDATTHPTAKIPLGTRFSLSLLKDSHAVLANFDLGTAALSAPQVDPALYPSAALLEFGARSPELTKMFQAVHLGTQTIVVTPLSSSVRTQYLTIEVVRPASLGTTHHTITTANRTIDLDAKIVEWADKRGIPPQLIKGIMDRETGSAFTPMEWRYEPLTTDWDGFSPLGQGRRSLARYEPYRMEYDANHLRGPLLIDGEDVHPRAIYYSDFAQRVHFADADQFVTAYQIVSENESWQNWIKILRNKAKRAMLVPAAIQGTLAWPANTTLASSYGLMQVMFEESFDNYGYAGVGGQRRPYYLFDTANNVAAGAGSIPVGTGVYVFKYRWENNFNATGDFSPQYDAPANLDDDYQNGLMGYNGEFCLEPACYGPDTMRRIGKYQPIAAGAIFP